MKKVHRILSQYYEDIKYCERKVRRAEIKYQNYLNSLPEIDRQEWNHNMGERRKEINHKYLKVQRLDSKDV